MSRTVRDNQRRLDHIYGLIWRRDYNAGKANWGSQPWRVIVRYSQSRRKYFAGIKQMKRHLIKKNRMHDRLYGHHAPQND